MFGGFKGKVREKLVSDYLRYLSGINPNLITLMGLLACSLSGLYFASHHPVIAGALIILGGFFDIMDGAVARVNSSTTSFGAFLDSICDRVGEGAIIIGAIWGGYTGIPLLQLPDWFLGASVLFMSVMVSYTRARGEALGVSMEGVGVGERPERMLAIAFGAFLYIFGFDVLGWVFLLLLVVCTITVVQRVYHIRSNTM
ncbi:MAG: CDP-alcohol phosphatidyltransferase family protein [Methermicoccaceae archaeon]